ncbi:MAG: hypothetical protein WAX80_00010 [Minisyncoccia bacterium]
MISSVFTAPLQCAESLHLGTLVSLLHADAIHRLRRSCGIESEHVLLWNVTGKHAEKAAVSLGLEVSENGCREAVSEFVRRNLEEIASWNIDINAIYRDDELKVADLENALGLLRNQGRLIECPDGWNMVVDHRRVLGIIEELPVVPRVRNKLKQCMTSFPALYHLHKERVYAVRVTGYEAISLDPKLCVALMPTLYGKGGVLVLGEDVIERMLLHHLIMSPVGCELAQGVVHGMLLGDDGKKMSRYASNAVKLGELRVDPDVARASILARPVSGNMTLESLQTTQARQLRSQFERILGTVGKRVVVWDFPDPAYHDAVLRLDFQALFQWFRVAINKELRDLVMRIDAGTATESEVLRTHVLCTVVGTALFPRTYA